MTVDEALGTSRLSVAVPAAGSVARAAHVLGPGRGAWVGELVRTGEAAGEPDRYLVDLELRVNERAPRMTFHKAALVDIGAAEVVGGSVRASIAWQAAGMRPLFPVFAGTLRWEDGMLRLDGVYAPPGGAIGAVADRLLLNVAARGTGKRLLEHIAATLAEGGGA